MPMFRKKPIVIEAIQFTGDNWNEILLFGDEGNNPMHGDESKIIIETLEGTMTAGVNDWIIKGVYGEFYPCKPDIFEETYEAVE